MAKSFIPSNYLKRAAAVAGGTAALALVLAFTADLWAQRKLPFIESALSEHLGRPVTVEQAHFGLFRGFTLNGLELKQHAPNPGVRIRRLSVLPSFRLFPPSIAVRRFVVEDAEITMFSLPKEGMDAEALIRGFSSELSRIGVVRLRNEVRSFEVRRARIAFHEETVLGALPAFDLWVSGSRRGDELRLKLSVQSGPVKMRGDGAASFKDGGHWHLSLASEELPLERFEDHLPWLVLEKGSLRFYAAARGYGKRAQPSLEMRLENAFFHDPKKRFAVSNLAGQIVLSEGRWQARELWGFVNGVPMRFDLRAGSAGGGRFVAEISSYPGQSEAMRAQHGGNGSLRIAAVASADGWSGHVRYRKTEYASGKKKEDVWTLSFRALRAGECRFLRLRRDDEITGGHFDRSVRRLAYFLMANDRFLQLEIVDLSLAEGRMRLRFQTRYALPGWKASLTLEGVDAAEWLRYMKATELPVTGRLSGTASWTGVAKGIKGRVEARLTDGRVGPDARLERWARETGIEVLRDIRYRTVAFQAEQALGEWSIKEFRLSGDSLELAAQLRLAKQRVFGALSVRIPTRTIQGSSDLRWLLKFVGAGEWVDFDFKVAGSAQAPRVYWQGGEFKRKLETRLAPWMRYELARQIEGRLMPVPVSGNSQA